MVDYGSSPNWHLVIRSTYLVTVTSEDPYEYTPIPVIAQSVTSRRLILGLHSETARQNWYLGAWVAQRLPLSPGGTSEFASSVQSSSQRAALNRLNLIEFPDFGIYPYVVTIKIPYWIEDMYLELWRHAE